MQGESPLAKGTLCSALADHSHEKDLLLEYSDPGAARVLPPASLDAAHTRTQVLDILQWVYPGCLSTLVLFPVHVDHTPENALLLGYPGCTTDLVNPGRFST